MIPYRRSQISVDVSAAEYEVRLARATAAKWPWFPSKLIGRYEFDGRVSKDGFTLSPVIPGRNTYLPRIIGSISAQSGGAEIRLTQMLHPVAIVGMMLVCGGPLVVSIWERDIASVLGLSAMFLAFHILMYYVGFKPEARRIEARLTEMGARSPIPIATSAAG
jgi:hypothetical protein